jgi:hypothetical protein
MFSCSSIGVRATLDASGSPRDDSMSGVRTFHLYSFAGSWSLLILMAKSQMGTIHFQQVLENTVC